MQRAGSHGMARSLVVLLWGTQLSQLTLDPPWTPVFQTETVMLTCRGSSMPGPTYWYINNMLWWQEGSDRIHASKDYPGSGSYQCRGPGAELSPPITLSFSNDWLILQVPARTLLEGDRLQLRCRGWKDKHISQVQFFHERDVLKDPTLGAELYLQPLQLHHSGHYHCQAVVQYLLVGWQKSAPVMVAVQELFSVPVLRLEGPAEITEGSPLALNCSSHSSPLRPPAHLQYIFYKDRVVVGGPQGSPQLQLLAVGLSHSGNYYCEVWAETASVWKHSAPVTVTVYRVPVSGVSLVAQPPGGQVVEGDRLALNCSVAVGTGPLSFSWHRQGSATPLAMGPRYELHAVGRQDSGRYHCSVTDGSTTADSPPLRVTVLVPVAGAAIAMARTEPSVLAGENLNLSCSVRAGTAPVNFTWLRDRQELGWGPLLSLGAVGPEHAGTYECLATNSLGTHRVFWARSPVLTLSVVLPGQGWQHQGTAMATGLSVPLLLLLAAVGWQLRRRHRAATRRSQGRDPTAPPEPEGHLPEPAAHPRVLKNKEVEDEEVLYTHVVVTKQGECTSASRPPWGSPHPPPPWEPPVTYAVLPGPHAQPQLPSDIYENIP
ncbi:low affinity immunoglobulin gamma Fc region receptor II-a isoform X1 [Falco biarmicus]|uniref:low affinity immunoglobulin gamma Fc region receptor II-a isoform X1 n=2 Tax=Falco biarmicus TaxID=345155 RepID=UPI0024BC384D|nr:low affinity immunoglobulin gamma Fc region receptor II-a isoform X1 [Falco biarmicus]